jgi:hypothetical protein
VELKKLLKVPRSARTIAITIVVPEMAHPSPAPALEQPKLTGWGRVWAVTRITGPAVVSIVAVIISILAFAEQKSADQDQQQVSQRQAAAQVSFLQEDSNPTGANTLVIKNLGANVIYSPVLSVDVSWYIDVTKNSAQVKTVTVELYLTTMPACSFAVINLDKTMQQPVWKTQAGTSVPVTLPEMAPIPSILVQAMTFTDSDGLSWQYLNGGGLQQVAAPPLSAFYSSTGLGGSADPSYKTASGCT